MAKNNLWILIVLGLLGVLYLLGNQTPSRAGTCSDVFCNTFEYICCGEATKPITTYNTGADLYTMKAYQCPTSSLRCEMDIEADTLYTLNNEQCWTFLALGGGYRWKCNNEQYLLAGGHITINGGGKVWSSSVITGRTISNIKEYSQRLSWCGLSACNAGETGDPVSGADGCSFTPKSGKVYDRSGNVINQNAVPLTQCYLSASSVQQVCGNTCNTCNSNADCGGHTYTYNGQGAECSSGRLQLYGCAKSTSYSNYDNLTAIGRGLVGYGNLLTNSKCVVNATISVQCCPYTDSCGLNKVCDPTTFTCKDTAECSQDWECGQAQTCDRVSKTIKKPVCSSGQCGQAVVKSVECCIDNDCPTNYYCDANKVCKQKTSGIQECPSQCCVGESQYYDKNCASGSCVNHQCSVIDNCGNKVCEFGESDQNCPIDCNTGDCSQKCTQNILGISSVDPVCLVDCYVKSSIGGVISWVGRTVGSLVIGVIGMALSFLMLTRKNRSKKNIKDSQIISILVFVVLTVLVYFI